MRVYVDHPDQGKPTEFAWHDRHGDVEFVKTDHGNVEICNSQQDSILIYEEDIPKLIKALEAAYTQINKEK